jgi:hypothetical protein
MCADERQGRLSLARGYGCCLERRVSHLPCRDRSARFRAEDGQSGPSQSESAEGQPGYAKRISAVDYKIFAVLSSLLARGENMRSATVRLSSSHLGQAL